MECDVCLIEWDSVVHIPRILNCGHTICEACLISMFRKAKSKESDLFCPSCMKKQKEITDEEDIKNLIKNINLLRITEKIEMRKSIMCQSFLSSRDNINLSFLSKTNFNASRIPSDKNVIFSTNELICKAHGMNVHSYNPGTNLYLCDLCLKENPIKALPLPNYIRDTKRKIDSSEVKICLIKQELERLQEFFISYQEEFEKTNMSKVDDLFQYLNKLILYNYNTAKTVVQQCKKEQDIQIENKMNELKSLSEQLREIELKLQTMSNNEDDDLLLVKSNENLNNIINQLNSFINYELEISLFQMKIGIKDDIKDKLFEFIQDSYYVDVDFATVKSEPPMIKHILQKEKVWQCICGEFENSFTNHKCVRCGLYRKIESYENLFSNPQFATKEEVTLLNGRRKAEIKEFQQYYSDKSLNEETKYYVLDLEWFLLWKCFVTNDYSDKYISNSKKRIIQNKSIGVLPPGPITNTNLFEKYNTDFNKDSLKKGLKKNDNYIIVNQNLWNFFYYNYNSSIEILLMGSSAEIYSSAISCKKAKFNYDLKLKNSCLAITPMDNLFNNHENDKNLISDNNNFEKNNEENAIDLKNTTNPNDTISKEEDNCHKNITITTLRAKSDKNLERKLSKCQITKKENTAKQIKHNFSFEEEPLCDKTYDVNNTLLSEYTPINPVANYNFKINFDHFRLSQENSRRTSIDIENMVELSDKLKIFFDK